MANRLAPKHISGEEWINERVAYAWQISQDPKFIYLIEAEGGWDEKTKSKKKYWCKRTKKYEWDWGIGQISACYHPNIVYNEKFINWRYQIEQAYQLYKTGTTFYGLANIWKTKNKFIWN